MSIETGEVKRYGGGGRSSCLWFVVLCCLGCGVYLLSQIPGWLNLTREAGEWRVDFDHELQLTREHGQEATRALDGFLSIWLSVEADSNPLLLADVAMSPYVDSLISPTPENGGICGLDECRVTKSFSIEGVRVLDYAQDRFKIIACVTENLEQVTPQGEYIAELPPDEYRTIYVFGKQGDSWKLEGAFELSDDTDHIYRDWAYSPDWLKAIIGELPSSFHCEMPVLE